jgi:coenzyme F420 hydrogenase subunit beta
MSNSELATFLKDQVVDKGICVGCGACVALLGGKMTVSNDGVFPVFSHIESKIDYAREAYLACPGIGIHYPSLYRYHYGKLPDSWLLGEVIKTRVGHSSDNVVRENGASGGVISQTLSYLLENNYIDVAIVVKQGALKADEANVVFAKSSHDIFDSAQSVYTPTSTLDILSMLQPKLKYAITCLPEQAAAIRVLQSQGYKPAEQVEYILGPYTGTALQSEAIRCLLRSNKIKNDDEIISLKWRAGAWPGYLEIKTKSGKVVRSKKVYYNFLIPFFVTQTSLQSMDFANEFSDLSVGDAWSPEYEKLGVGFSVITTRSKKMESIVKEMINDGCLSAEDIDKNKASEMHGHMLDFKKRGGFIRNKWRRYLGFRAPNYGIIVNDMPMSRYIVEIVISGVFIVCRNSISRKILEFIPESIIGPFFNKSRLLWKNLSKPTKRQGLSDLNISEVDNGRMF